MNWTLVQNSLAVGLAAAALASLFGFITALWAMSLSARGQKWVLFASVIALVMPPFLIVNCWLHYFGHTGVLRNWLPLNLFSMGGTIWILTLMLWPVSFLLVLGSWKGVQQAELESDPLLKGGALLRWVMLPRARAGLVLAALISFVLALNNFAVPAILQVRVFPAELWVSFNTLFDFRAAWMLSWPLVMAPLLLLVTLRRRQFAWPWRQGGVKGKVFERRLGAPLCRASALFGWVLLFLSVGLPVWQLISSERTWIELPPAFAAGRMAFLNSFLFAALAATLIVAVAFATWRRPIGTLLWVTFLVPGVLLGIVCIWIFNRPAFGWFYQGIGIVVFAYAVKYVAIGWNGVALGLRGADRNLLDVARMENANRLQTIRHVYWPQCAPRIAAAWYITYLLCLWDVEALILIMPPGAETLAVRIFNLLHYGHNAQVNALCLGLIAVALLPLSGWFVISREGFRRKTTDEHR